MECQNRSKNNKDCPCKELDCPNHGICCKCVRAHWPLTEKPACMR